jgi:hypothetical protein
MQYICSYGLRRSNVLLPDKTVRTGIATPLYAGTQSPADRRPTCRTRKTVARYTAETLPHHAAGHPPASGDLSRYANCRPPASGDLLHRVNSRPQPSGDLLPHADSTPKSVGRPSSTCRKSAATRRAIFCNIQQDGEPSGNSMLYFMQKRVNRAADGTSGKPLYPVCFTFPVTCDRVER